MLQKVIFSYVRAIFLFTSILSLPQKISLEVGFSKPYSGYSHFFKHLKLCTFLINVERDEFGLGKRKAFPFANPVFTP